VAEDFREATAERGYDATWANVAHVRRQLKALITRPDAVETRATPRCYTAVTIFRNER
jgi:hypothetical protein